MLGSLFFLQPVFKMRGKFGLVWFSNVNLWPHCWLVFLKNNDRHLNLSPQLSGCSKELSGLQFRNLDQESRLVLTWLDVLSNLQLPLWTLAPGCLDACLADSWLKQSAPAECSFAFSCLLCFSKTPLICSSALLGLVWQTVGLVAAELVEPGIGIHPPTLSSHLHFPSQCSRLTLSCKRQHNFTRGRRKASHRWIVPSGLEVDTAGKCQTGYIEHNEGLRIYADSLWPTGMTRLALVSQLHNGRHSHTVSVKHHTITHHHTTLKKF